MRLVLASASPARLATLRAAGLDPEVVVSGVDEEAVGAAAGVATVLELTGVLAVAKALDVARQIVGDAVVLGCDSLLEHRGEAMGKPGSADRTRERWATIAGGEAVLHSGHCLVVITDGAVTDRADAVASTTVHFGRPTDAELAAYVASGEPQTVAGGFTLDGLGGWFVDGIEGDHGTVIGVSLPTVRTLLHEVGLSLLDLGWPAGTAGTAS